MQSGNLIPTIGAKFYNNTGYTITQLPISYFGEQWRLGTIGREDRLDFQYSLDANSLNSGTWQDVNNLDFIAPVQTESPGAKDGNSSSYRTSISFTITGLNIPNGSYFWIRWTDYNATSSDDGLAIDEFSIDQSALPVTLEQFTYFVKSQNVHLFWRTSTEVNNYGWEVERSKIDKSTNKPAVWQKIGFVKGSGNSNSPKEYSFVDKDALYGEYAYRLKQIDIDGTTSFSEELRVFVGNKPEVYDLKAYPNPFNPATTIRFSLPESGNVKLSIYDALGRFVETLVDDQRDAGIYEFEYNASKLSSGIYFTILQVNNIRIVNKLQLIK
ncbi:MAG: T9SS type A sorting domain-containing protein [Ignavibacteria bacterium]|nr:T9SS type A sorting domain-containing protein [Ignavibacteria bacterium]